jgi:hypothetical protein
MVEYIPEVTLLQIINETTALSIKSSNSDFAFKHVGPLGFLVPMKLTNHALFKAHVDASKFLASTKLSDSRLTSPAAFLNSNMRVGERPPHIWNSTMICAGRTHKVWILAFTSSIARTEHICTVTIAL